MHCAIIEHSQLLNIFCGSDNENGNDEDDGDVSDRAQSSSGYGGSGNGGGFTLKVCLFLDYWSII